MDRDEGTLTKMSNHQLFHRRSYMEQYDGEGAVRKEIVVYDDNKSLVVHVVEEGGIQLVGIYRQVGQSLHTVVEATRALSDWDTFRKMWNALEDKAFVLR